MSYTPDYERTLNEVVETVMPKTPGDWGLVALAILGLCLVIIVLEMARAHCTPKEDETTTQDPVAPAEQ